ncbi:hypothetical protein VTK26DRAFT_381 [Humicola hyalothermophila]
MTEWVDTFLDKLSKRFVPVIPFKALGRKRVRGATWRKSWMGRNRDGKHPLDVWKPENAAQIALNRFDLDAMAAALRGRDWATYYIIQVSIAFVLAHELVHIFVGLFMRYPDTMSTPVTVGGTELFSQITGNVEPEAGWAWDLLLGGGALLVFEKPRDPLGALQSGEIWIKRHDGIYEKVDLKRILDIAGGGPDVDKHFPIPVVKGTATKCLEQRLMLDRPSLSGSRYKSWSRQEGQTSGPPDKHYQSFQL